MVPREHGLLLLHDGQVLPRHGRGPQGEALVSCKHWGYGTSSFDGGRKYQSLALPLLGKQQDWRGAVRSALGVALVGWCWNGQRRLSGTAGWASPPRGMHELLSGVLPGPGLLLPSCLRGGKRRVLGQADPT